MNFVVEHKQNIANITVNYKLFQCVYQSPIRHRFGNPLHQQYSLLLCQARPVRHPQGSFLHICQS